jgi:hypothetical protein
MNELAVCSPEPAWFRSALVKECTSMLDPEITLQDLTYPNSEWPQKNAK